MLIGLETVGGVANNVDSDHTLCSVAFDLGLQGFTGLSVPIIRAITVEEVCSTAIYILHKITDRQAGKRETDLIEELLGMFYSYFHSSQNYRQTGRQETDRLD